MESGALRRAGNVFAGGVGREGEVSANGSSDIAAGNRDAAKVLRAVVLGDEVDEAAISRKTRTVDGAIEGQGENFRFAAVRWRDGEMLRGVVDGLDVDLADERRPFAGGRPGGRMIRAAIRGDAREVRAFVAVVGIDDPNV